MYKRAMTEVPNTMPDDALAFDLIRSSGGWHAARCSPYGHDAHGADHPQSFALVSVTGFPDTRVSSLVHSFNLERE